jgi:hypothetical protein
MSEDVRQGVYRAALDAANVELSEIVVEFEKLRRYKALIGNVVESLKTVLGGEGLVAGSAQQAPNISSDRMRERVVTFPEPIQQGENPSQYPTYLIKAERDEWSSLSLRPPGNTGSY